MHVGIESGCLRDILKLAVAEVVVKAKTALWSIIRDEDIHSTVPVIVQETCTRADIARREVPLNLVPSHCRGPDGAGLSHDPRLLRHIHKPHPYLRRDFLH